MFMLAPGVSHLPVSKKVAVLGTLCMGAGGLLAALADQGWFDYSLRYAGYTWAAGYITCWAMVKLGL